MADELAYLTASELLARYQRRALSPLEVVRALLARVDALQPKLNAFVVVDHEAALEAARTSEARWQRGAPLGRLDGVPVSIKDLLQTRGWPTRKGSKTSDARGPWDSDAPAVARLREHGAILFGKTTTTEFGLKGLGDSPLSGITRNPWNLAHTPGGSSAGAAAATAAGLGPLAIGTDGGGSIRVPASYSGVFGLKPTFGRVPTDPPALVGVPPHVGPIARGVADLALALAVISEPDASDPWSAQVAASTFDVTARSLRGLRIAYSKDLGYAELDPEVEASFGRAVVALRELGAHVQEAQPAIASPGPVIQALFQARAAETVRSLSAAQRALLDPEIERAARAGEALPLLEYLQAESARVELVRTFAEFHRHFDLLVTPAAAAPAPLAEPLSLAPDAPPPRASLAAPFSLTRQPAASVPWATTRAGLPIGLQLVGRHFEEQLVLRVAAALESVAPFARPPLEI